MRFCLPVLLSLTIALPAFAEPPAVTNVARSEAITEAPLASERTPRDSMPPTRVAGITLTSIGAALATVGTGFAIAASTIDASDDVDWDGECDPMQGDTCMRAATTRTSKPATIAT